MADAVIEIDYFIFTILYVICFYYLKTTEINLTANSVLTFINIIFTGYVTIKLYKMKYVRDISVNYFSVFIAGSIISTLLLYNASLILTNLTLGKLDGMYKIKGRDLRLNKSQRTDLTRLEDYGISFIACIIVLLFVLYNNDTSTFIFRNMFNMAEKLKLVSSITIFLLCIYIISFSSYNVYLSKEFMDVIQKIRISNKG